MNSFWHPMPPTVFADMAFMRCMYAAALDEVLVKEFCRLYRLKVDQFLRTQQQRKKFAQFVFNAICSRLSEEVLAELRNLDSEGVKNDRYH